MMHKKLHTGSYCCPECCLDYNLIAQERLKCEDCGGMLVAGSLEDFEDAQAERTEEQG